MQKICCLKVFHGSTFKLTSERMFLLIVIVRKTPNISLIWFAPISLQTHPKDGEWITLKKKFIYIRKFKLKYLPKKELWDSDSMKSSWWSGRTSQKLQILKQWNVGSENNSFLQEILCFSIGELDYQIQQRRCDSFFSSRYKLEWLLKVISTFYVNQVITSSNINLQSQLSAWFAWITRNLFYIRIFKILQVNWISRPQYHV